MISDQKPNDLQVLHEDEHCLFISKPSGVLTQAPAKIDSMESRIKQYLPQKDPSFTTPYLGVPHRLDRAASGVMVFAKTRSAARTLAEQFQSKKVEKTYWMLVEDRFKDEHGTWIDWMRKIEGEPRSEIVSQDHPEAKQAILHFVNRGHFEGITWLEVHLETGRNHQIRLQAGTRGHPILGDQLYGSIRPFGEQFPDERLRAIALHARRLTLKHPASRKSMTVEAPPPESWQPYFSAIGTIT
jgi:23S rRNA pseudouridine1911/1915/1917 synthase